FSSPVVDVLIIAKAATARGCRTVGGGKSGGARNGGLSGRAAPMDCNFIALGRSRCHSGSAKNNCSGKRYFDEHFRLLPSHIETAADISARDGVKAPNRTVGRRRPEMLLRLHLNQRRVVRLVNGSRNRRVHAFDCR